MNNASSYQTELGEFNNTIANIYNTKRDAWVTKKQEDFQKFLDKKQSDVQTALAKVEEGKQDEETGIQVAESAPLVKQGADLLSNKVLKPALRKGAKAAQPYVEKGFKYAGEKLNQGADYLRNGFRTTGQDDGQTGVEIADWHDPRMVTSDPVSRGDLAPGEQEGIDARNTARQGEAEGSGLNAPDEDMEAFKRQFPGESETQQGDEALFDKPPYSFQGPERILPEGYTGDLKGDDGNYPDFTMEGHTAQAGLEPEPGELAGDTTYPDFGASSRTATTGLENQGYGSTIGTPGGERMVKGTTEMDHNWGNDADDDDEAAVGEAGGDAEAAADVAEDAGLAGAEEGLDAVAATNWFDPVGWIAGIGALGLGIFGASSGSSEVSQGQTELHQAQAETPAPPPPPPRVSYSGTFISPVSSNLY